MKKIILSFAIALSSYCSDAQVFDTGNYVGIGTPNPQEKLEVTGNEKLFGDLIFGSDQTAYFIHGPGNGGAIRFRTNITQGIDRNVQFGNIDNNGTWHSFMTVDQTSNVGIGTTSPASALDIGGLLQLSAINSATPPAGLSYGLFPYGGVGLGLFSGAIGATQGIGIWTNPGGVKTEVMRILSGGNVGIGTTSPDAKLAVKGTIHTQEVKVDMVGWGDDVFDKGYPLKSLSSVKNYIDQNHHLPEVPSEAEVIKNGVNVGEILKLQTKKIEELTLYLIDKDKQDKEKDVKLAEQQTQIDELKVQLRSIAKYLPKN